MHPVIASRPWRDARVVEEARLETLANQKNQYLCTRVQDLADMNHIVLETDAPYLAPVPYRGRRNEPVYIWKTAEKVADTFGLTLDETVQITRKNALDLFKIPNKKA